MSRGRSTVALFGIYGAIALVTGLHYLTGAHEHQLHDIYRRLYYLPIILAAFRNGLRGGLIAAVVVCLAYLPHALGHISHDPASDTQKLLEMALYLAVGIVTGSLVSRLTGTQRRLQATAQELESSLEQLRAAEERLVREARLAAVGRLSAGLAHEIRNPLASIKGSAEILADDFPPSHPKRRMLQVLNDEAVRLGEVLTRFLAFARPAPPQRAVVSAVEEIESVVTLLRSRPDAEGRRLVFAGESGDPLRLHVDPSQFRQVLLNVLLNALQATASGGEVRVEAARRGPDTVLRVLDSGPGFTEEALASAFTPFFTTKSGGTGLGLAISHRIMEQHGGTIRLGNVPGGGLVEIVLPAAD